MDKPQVAVLMGSDSDVEVMQGCFQVLESLNILFEAKITSAHRTPGRTQVYITTAEQRGVKVFIAAAGMAAHLAGTVAAHTTKPVIGVPVDASSLQGLDSLLSTVQMPAGIPVATVAIGKSGAKNAAYLAAQILALEDHGLAQRLKQIRSENEQMIIDKDETLQKQLILET